jgi:WD40 repeat protein
MTNDDEILHRHFIAVATGVYDGAEFAPLPVRDEVDEFQQWLCGAALGTRAFNRTELAYEPTIDMVTKALNYPDPPWTESHAVAVYVTGHGFKDGEHWIALKGTDTKKPGKTALSTALMIRWLIESDIDHLLVIVDLCYAGDGLRALLEADIVWKPTWLLLASAGKLQTAETGALAVALRRFLADARATPQKFGHGPYFAAAEFIAAINERLPADQELAPLQANFPGPGANLCLPNPAGRSEPATDPAVRPTDLAAHWSPRARGVARDADPGWFFTGRPDVMRRVLDFARGEPGAMVVSGRAGAGKSAVLSRLVTLADSRFLKRYAVETAAIAPALRPEAGSVDVAVLARGKLSIQVLDEICTAVGADRPGDATGLPGLPGVHDLQEAWWAWLRTRDRPVTVVVDALEEADNPRAVVDEVLSRIDLPDGPRRVRLLVGVRSPGGDLAEPRIAFADATQKTLHADRLRLDEPPYGDAGDVADFALDVLTSTPGSPYQPTDHELAGRVVARIAANAGTSYLLAREAASSLTARDEVVDPDDPQWLRVLGDGLPGIVRDDIARTVERPEARERVVQLLRSVAFGYGAGVPWYKVWAEVATAISGTMTFGDLDIEGLLASPLAGYLTTGRDDGVTSYRIADDTLRQVLREQWWVLAGQEPPAERESIAEVEAKIAEALIPRRSRSRTLAGVPAAAYVRRHLVEHAAAGGMLDQETVPDWFLPQLDPTRLRQADPTATGLPLSPAVRRLAHRWDWHRPRFNAAALRMSSALHGTPLPAAAFEDDWVVPWASSSRDASEILGPPHPGVVVVASARADGRVFTVTGGADGLRVWDLAGGTRLGEPIMDVPGPISALAVVTLPSGQPVAVAVSDAQDGVWAVDLLSAPLRGRLAIAGCGRIRALGTAVLAGGRTIVVTGDDQGRFRSWDLQTGAQVGEPAQHHSGPINAISTVTSTDGTVLAVTAGDDGTIRIWDPSTADAVGEPMTGHIGPVSAICATLLGGRPTVVTGGYDATVRVWDLADRVELDPPLTGHAGTVWAVSTTVLADDRVYAITCADDPAVRVWDLAAHALHDDSLISPGRPVAAVTAVRLPETGPTLVTGGRDGTIRSWILTARPVAGAGTASPDRDRVSSLAVGVRPDGGAFAVTGSDADAAAVWNLADGANTEVILAGHTKPVSAVCTVLRPDGTTAIVTAAWDATVRVWDPIDGRQLGDPLRGHAGPVLSLAATVTADGRLVAVSGGMDGTVRLWDLARSSAIASFPSGSAWVTAVATARLPDGRAVAVTGTRDGRLTAWDLERPGPLSDPVPGHRGGVRALATAVVDGRAVVVSGGDDSVVRIWDLLRMKAVGRRMTGHDGQVAAIATGTLSNGRTVALTGGDDAAVRVWDLATLAPVGAELPTPTAVRALAVDTGTPGLRIVMAGNGFLAVADR